MYVIGARTILIRVLYVCYLLEFLVQVESRAGGKRCPCTVPLSNTITRGGGSSSLSVSSLPSALWRHVLEL